MTVADLIKKLQRVDPKMPIVMSSDPEGNELCPIDAVTPMDEDDANYPPNQICVIWPGSPFKTRIQQ